jgi:fructosamine-3-kinase
MFDSELQKRIAELTGPIQNYAPLSGGDIHLTLKLDTPSGPWVVKVANDPLKVESLIAEHKGLVHLTQSETFAIPELLGLIQTSAETALVMRFVAQRTPDLNFWENFAEKLISLHSQSQPKFGLDHDNFIGALPQHNQLQNCALDFYINDRLEPQFTLAAASGYTLKREAFYKRLEELIPTQRPALIHGDLWNGNYLSGVSGPVLIDPAISYGIAMMDLAMMDLFGGFDETVFTLYGSAVDLDPNWRSSLDIYQLYYLLVHLNLFGSSYLASVNRILNKYS